MKASNVFIAKEPHGAGGGNSRVPVPCLAAAPTEPPCHVPVLSVSSAGLQMILEMVLLSENINGFVVGELCLLLEQAFVHSAVKRNEQR